ncbi:SEC-C motif [Novosphingobium resinovorum]|uniref:SEC-C motif n=1 Tax=Novosphingobium resinovorum TaxID=158500 RepID=A0A031J3G7_9SPHN|nr:MULTISPECIES: SEC-C metal-binding domain-containing protein [Novosphingobium]EZP68023.1 SEC-C motif [Novosphingobium resinovorum]
MNLNDPCMCGSGKPYKKCHRSLHRTPPRRYLEEARKFYINRWVVNASVHARAEHYDWMIDQVPGPVHRLLDIGVGEGSGLAAMLRRYSPENAVAIEENPECVRRARTKLCAADEELNVVTRMTTVPMGMDSKAYDLEFTRNQVPSTGLTIVVTDPLFDKHLAEDFSAAGPFDLVTVWLVGSHEARENSRDLMALGPMTAAKYRLLVQNAAYELADKLLAVGGRLQVVDRLPVQDLALARAELLASHTDQAAPTTLKVANIAFLKYQEVGSGGVKMLLKNHGQGTPMGNTPTTLLASVVSVKG